MGTPCHLSKKIGSCSHYLEISLCGLAQLPERYEHVPSYIVEKMISLHINQCLW